MTIIAIMKITDTHPAVSQIYTIQQFMLVNCPSRGVESGQEDTSDQFLLFNPQSPKGNASDKHTHQKL